MRLPTYTRGVAGWSAGCAAAAAALWLMTPGQAYAAPVCPEQTVRTPYMTPVSATLACTDPLHPIIRYEAFQYPGFTISGDQAMFTPGPLISNIEVPLTYYAVNAIFERSFGFLNVQVGGPPTGAPPNNRPPVAHCDSYSVRLGEDVKVPIPGVLANDSDPDGDALHALWAYADADAGFPEPTVGYNGSLRFRVPERLPGGRDMLSYRYIATDGHYRTESTVTFWVGTKDQGCRPPAEPPPTSETKRIETLSTTSGAVRIRTKGRWRRLGARHSLKRALLVDARRGGVRVRLVLKNNYLLRVSSARFGGGMFKLGEDVKYPNGTIFSTFTRIRLAGARRCPGPGRGVNVAVTGPEFFINALALQANGLMRRKRRIVSRFRVADRCNATSVVALRRGRVLVRDVRGSKTLTGRQTYVARPLG